MHGETTVMATVQPLAVIIQETADFGHGAVRVAALIIVVTQKFKQGISYILNVVASDVGLRRKQYCAIEEIVVME